MCVGQGDIDDRGAQLPELIDRCTDRIAHTGWQLGLSGLVILPLALIIEGLPASVSVPNLMGLAYLGLVATGLASVLWFRGIDRLPVAAPPLLGLASAMTGVVVGWLVLGQSLTLLQSAGFLVTLGAIAYGALVRDAAPQRSGGGHGDVRAPVRGSTLQGTAATSR